MKIFTKEGIWKKLVISFLIIFSIQYTTARTVHAADALEFGGKLVSPVASLLVALRRWCYVYFAFFYIRNRGRCIDTN